MADIKESTTDDLTDLERAAASATPGPWLNGDSVSWDDPKYCGYDSVRSEGIAPVYYATGPEAKDATQASADAAFIARANPTRITALVTELRGLRAAAQSSRIGFGMQSEPCPGCGKLSRATTAGCDHCEYEDK